MTSGNIGLGDYSEIIATKIGHVADGIPDEGVISVAAGVDANAAAEYKSRLKQSLREFAAMVDELSTDVAQFAMNSRDAVAAIRAADQDAEEQAKKLLVDIENGIKAKHQQSKGNTPDLPTQQPSAASAAEQRLR